MPPGPTYLYGRNPVREALRGRRRVRAVLLAERLVGEGGERLEEKVAEWCRTGAAVNAGAVAAAATRGLPPVRHLSAIELTALLHTSDHQGIAAEVDPYPYLEAEDIARTHTLLIALDGVQDPHNLGAIVRTAEGAGAGVLIPRHRAVEVTAAVVKASAGATEHAAVARVRNLADLLASLKRDGFWIYGAAAGAKSDYTAQDYSYPTCFVVGSEGEGLGRRVASLCDVLVSLPLIGRVESLNVSVSAGVLLYEAVRQRRRSEEPGSAAGGEAGT
jgi:23S rRNA (guanosine2251-2'-O)-methyltransferase